MVIPEDTPAPLTAPVLASERRRAGANLFEDGSAAPGQDDGWDRWAEGLTDTDERLAELDAHLRQSPPRIVRYAHLWRGRLHGRVTAVERD